MPAEKRRSNTWFFSSFLVLIGIVFFSCTSEDCVSTVNNYLLVGFFKKGINQAGEHPEIDTVFYSVQADGNDVEFYTPGTTVSRLTLPVNPADNVTSFELTMLDSITYDSLNNPIYYINPNPHYITVSYHRSQRIISEDCGVEIAYSNLKINEITFDSTNLVENNLSRFNEVNIEIFF